MKSHTFDAFDHISVISFLSALRLAFITIESFEDASIWVFHFFMENAFAAALNARLSIAPTSSSNTRGAKEYMLRPYAEEFNYFPLPYATDAAITETDAALTRYTLPQAMPPTEKAETFLTESFKCGKVHDEYVVKSIFIERRHEFVRQSTRSHWCMNPRGNAAQSGSSQDVTASSTAGN